MYVFPCNDDVQSQPVSLQHVYRAFARTQRTRKSGQSPCQKNKAVLPRYKLLPARRADLATTLSMAFLASSMIFASSSNCLEKKVKDEISLCCESHTLSRHLPSICMSLTVTLITPPSSIVAKVALDVCSAKLVICTGFRPAVAAGLSSCGGGLAPIAAGPSSPSGPSDALRWLTPRLLDLLRLDLRCPRSLDLDLDLRGSRLVSLRLSPAVTLPRRGGGWRGWRGPPDGERGCWRVPALLLSLAVGHA